MKESETIQAFKTIFYSMVSIFILSVIARYVFEIPFKETCNQEVISQLSLINERLDNVMFWQNYLSDLIDNK